MASMHDRSRQPELRTLGSMRSSWVFYGRTVVRPATGNAGKDAVNFVSSDANHFLIATRGELKKIDRLVQDFSVRADKVYGAPHA